MAITKKSPAPIKKNPVVVAKTAPKAPAKPIITSEKKKSVAVAVPPVAVAAPVEASPKAKRVTFKVHADSDSLVYVAGDFNNWNVTANPLSDSTGKGEFSAVLTLAPGNYQYKFVINGTWCVDPECTEWVQNNLGTLNSVLKV